MTWKEFIPSSVSGVRMSSAALGKPADKRHALTITFDADACARFDIAAGQHFKLFLGDGGEVNKLRLAADDHGPFKSARQGHGLRLNLLGVPGAPNARHEPEYVDAIKVETDDFIEITAPDWFGSRAAKPMPEPEPDPPAVAPQPETTTDGDRTGRWSDEEVETLKRCRAEGRTAKQIAAELGRTESMVTQKAFTLRLPAVDRKPSISTTEGAHLPKTGGAVSPMVLREVLSGDAEEFTGEAALPKGVERRCPGCRKTFKCTHLNQRICPACKEISAANLGGTA